MVFFFAVQCVHSRFQGRGFRVMQYQNHSYLNIVVTVLTAAVIFFGIAFVVSTDRLRYEVENLRRQIQEMQEIQ